MRGVNVMLPSAEWLYRQIADTSAPPLTTVFDTLASQPWDPDVHDFAWQVIAGQLPTTSSPVGSTGCTMAAAMQLLWVARPSPYRHPSAPVSELPLSG
jgi:hypothetical protein